MLTYEEFSAQHHRVVDAAAGAGLTKLATVNLTGLTGHEAVDHMIGVYIRLLVDFSTAAAEDKRNSFLAHAVGTLIDIYRHDTGDLAPCISIDEIDSLDEVSISLLDTQLADFCRMNPTTFIGYAMTYCDFAVKDKEDLRYWLCMQFDIVSKYAFTHFIDLPHLISELD